MHSLKLKNLTLSKNNDVLYSNLNMELTSGQIAGLYGPTGAGKTTLLNLLAGFELPECFSVEGNFVHDCSKISYMFQDLQLLPGNSVLKNVMLPVEKLYGKSEAENKAMTMLHLVDLETKSTEKVKNLSGGEQQRVALARALLYPGELLLLDEPFSAQDDDHKAILIPLIKEIIQTDHRLAIVITHNKEDLSLLNATIVT